MKNSVYIKRNDFKARTRKLYSSLPFQLAAVIFVIASTVYGFHLTHKAVAYPNGPTITISSPRANTTVDGPVTISATLSGMAPQNYDMFWYVDNGKWNWMNSAANGDAKQANIDVAGWTWHNPNKQYTINLVAVLHSNNQRVYSSVPITIGVPLSVPTTTLSNSASASTGGATSSTSTNINSSSPLVPPPASTLTPPPTTTSLYVDPNSNAARLALQTTDPTLKRILTRLATQSSATWFGGWNNNVNNDVDTLVSKAASAHQTPILVAYNIPQRDCGGYSSGGTSSAAAYQAWIKAFSDGIANRNAIVILEPDALAQIGCLSNSDQTRRYQLLSFAVSTLKANVGTKVYIDAGHPGWIGASDMASRLQQANVAGANGFSLNVSNFGTTQDNLSYGHQISNLTGGKHFVIDTSRNGNGSNGEWCNPSGRALGAAPTTATNDATADYYLWIKTPGESDGTCNGGPSAGTWWPDYAINLAKNANY